MTCFRNAYLTDMHCGFVFFPATEGQSQLTIRYPKSYFLKTRIKPQSYLIEKEEKKSVDASFEKFACKIAVNTRVSRFYDVNSLIHSVKFFNELRYQCFHEQSSLIFDANQKFDFRQGEKG